METEEQIAKILLENKFLVEELRKLKLLHDDAVRANQNLKFQLIQMHEKLNLKKQYDDFDFDGRC